MQTNLIHIHIEWDGPFTLAEVKNLNQPHDYGLYQVYGPHPTYCRVELLYIGQASKQTFGARVPTSAGWGEHTRDSSQIAIYVGRLAGSATPENSMWEQQISLAERLLIHAHYPTYNTQKQLGALASELNTVHVMNWKRHRDLLPEVSGVRLRGIDVGQVYGKHENLHQPTVS